MFGDLYLCQFPFSSGDFSKPRPDLVLFEFQRDAVICKVTSVARSGPRDVELDDWQMAGLAKASVARIDKLVTAESVLLHRRLGTLSDADKSKVRSVWNQTMTL